MGWHADGVVLELRNPIGDTSSTVVEAVLDLDGQGDVVGIEILDLAAQSGLPAEQISEALDLPSTELSWSYDKNADAFYARRTGERSLDQQLADVRLIYDASGPVRIHTQCGV